MNKDLLLPPDHDLAARLTSPGDAYVRRATVGATVDTERGGRGMIEIIEHGPVRELRLARPPANALDPGLLAEIGAQVESAPRAGARALVLSGSEGLFTGGLDVPVLIGLDRDGMAEALELFFDAMTKLAGSEVPVAAAITGHSPAGGAVLSLFCDWRVMADGPYRIGLNEVRVGIPMPILVADALAEALGVEVDDLVYT